MFLPADWINQKKDEKICETAKIIKVSSFILNDCQLYSIAIFNYLLAYLKHYIIVFLVATWTSHPLETVLRAHSPWNLVVMS